MEENEEVSVEEPWVSPEVEAAQAGETVVIDRDIAPEETPEVEQDTEEVEFGRDTIREVEE